MVKVSEYQTFNCMQPFFQELFDVELSTLLLVNIIFSADGILFVLKLNLGTSNKAVTLIEKYYILGL